MSKTFKEMPYWKKRKMLEVTMKRKQEADSIRIQGGGIKLAYLLLSSKTKPAPLH